MSNGSTSLLFIHNAIEYYALSDVLGDLKKILSFGNYILQEVKILGENINMQVYIAC